MKTLDVLIEARELIANKRNWCVGVLSCRSFPGQTKYCAVGAVNKVAMGSAFTWLRYDDPAFKALFEQVPAGAIDATCYDRWPEIKAASVVAQYNNATSHKAVIKMFDDAISALRRSEAVDALLLQAVENATRDIESIETVG